MDDSSISISQALNHIQSWLNAGEYEKATQGCGEILELEPGNQRALALMKLAEERRHGVTQAERQTTPEPKTAPSTYDPLAHLQVENSPSRFEHDGGRREASSGEKRQFFLAMLIPAVLVVMIGGSMIWYFANQQRSDLLAGNTQTNVTETVKNRSYLAENDTRIDEMTQIKKVLDEYKAKNGSYPSISQIETVLAQSETFKTIPVDPRQGEIDKAGKAYGYIYATYGVFGKENQIYILSALFEDSKGFGYVWTSGAPSKNYPDYRTVDGTHATFIDGSKE